MTKHITEPSRKSSKGETLFLAGIAIDEDLREYLVAVTESVAMNINWAALNEATDPMASFDVGLRMMQRHNQEHKASRTLAAARIAKGEKPA